MTTVSRPALRARANAVAPPLSRSVFDADGQRGLLGRTSEPDGRDMDHVFLDSVWQLRVLVVDDCRDCADSSLLLLEFWGHDGRAVYGGREALDAVESFRPDVCLLDIGMPRMAGYELAGRLRERFREALLVAVTGYAHDGHRVLGREAGYDLYLTKPVKPPELEALLRHECEKLAALGRARHDVCLPIRA